MPVKLETANCLSMCGAGPNLVLYPDGKVFNHVDETALDEFIEANLRG
jgi:(2Fe-2S) ferredoxin